jgi:hypothetical protein
MKQEMRRTRKASEARPALDEMADFKAKGGPASLLIAAPREQHGSKRRVSRHNPKAPCHCGD